MPENKTYEVQGQKFELRPLDLSAKKAGLKLTSKLYKLQHEYLGGIDFSAMDKYESRLEELNTAKSQVELIVKDTKGKEHKEKTIQLKTLNENIKKVNKKYNADIEARDLKTLKEQLNTFAMADLLIDTDFIKSIFSLILNGNLDNVELKPDFASEVINDFFLLFGQSKKK